ncbi:MAG: hypothetical protein RMJ87_01605 [Cytophagales bacterium]|nr:hypothetical protein [Bernardetiaceae bacterium]MDW8203698.1 hypothetical protein [Cytophagales bacterium]
MKSTASIFLFLFHCTCICAQTNSLRFRITHIKEVSGCKQGQGILFEQGHIWADDMRKPVQVALYLEKTNGAFEVMRRNYPAGTVNVKLDILGCDYTGNHYAYIKYADDSDFTFPNPDEVYKRHQETLQTKKPEFLVSTIKPNAQCPNSYRIESGLVYSPAGGRVEIKLYLETVSGEWRTLNLYRYGSGPLPINYAACDLTGNTRAIASFGHSISLSGNVKN